MASLSALSPLAQHVGSGSRPFRSNNCRNSGAYWFWGGISSHPTPARRLFYLCITQPVDHTSLLTTTFRESRVGAMTRKGDRYLYHRAVQCSIYPQFDLFSFRRVHHRIAVLDTMDGTDYRQALSSTHESSHLTRGSSVLSINPTMHHDVCTFGTVT